MVRYDDSKTGYWDIQQIHALSRSARHQWMTGRYGLFNSLKKIIYENAKKQYEHETFVARECLICISKLSLILAKNPKAQEELGAFEKRLEEARAFTVYYISLMRENKPSSDEF